MKNNRNFRLIGNFLILGALILFGYIYYPIFALYFFPQKIDKSIIAKSEYSIEIPKIDIVSNVIPNVDPFNTTDYQNALKKGVAHAKNTALPGKNGTIFIFAHSSGAPWDQTHYNTIFMRLGKLQAGDTVYLYHHGKQFKYIVREKKEVWPNEVNYLLDTKKNQLIIQTCTPIGTDIKRLLIFANPRTSH